MNFIYSVLIIISFVIAFIGLIKPVIPSVLFVWIGFLIYDLGINHGTLSWIFWIAMILLTAFIFISDLMMNRFFVQRFGGSKQGEWAALVGVIIGSFVIPPFGVIVVPFILVFVVEVIQKQDIPFALKASVGSLVAFFSSVFAQGLVMLLMIIWFVIDAFMIN
ncbi:DUF456 domain-containing protein [Staphylococcus felis]|uniref:DUF456 domain-containing protein n=1 Tax=Staphylococcus felis TaxID=46127 RepID=A0A3E0IRW7_9STAP|nr:DUF456 domain-containing protein [Staphylococcus felis]MDM8327021.1 DUF456 domain-containing protein [Staphylococcus felis]MDQ7192530.1 DUF456 domain-containing protein [Staphylococcus felis]REH75293.1 DUF456 domain-containing protein [Staphylococcus felis]REH79839.1 DUF456 domain-containing protein [Staphylococcus felis]REH85723.1 DUF456 domain-containing protein [Staphylococcus felis]